MSDEVEHLNRVLDNLAGEISPDDGLSLSPTEVKLAQTAAFLRAAAPGRERAGSRFVTWLSARLGTLHAWTTLAGSTSKSTEP